MASPSKVYDINNLYHKLGEDTCSSILTLHAITGRDTVGRFAGKGKASWHTHYKEYKSVNSNFIVTLQEFGDTPNVLDAEQTVLERYISYFIYKERFKPWGWFSFTRKFVKAGKLLSTASSFKQHLLRTVYQTFIWKQSGKRLIVYPDASNFGWRQVDGKWCPFPTENPPVTNNIVELIKCNCTGKCGSRK